MNAPRDPRSMLSGYLPGRAVHFYGRVYVGDGFTLRRSACGQGSNIEMTRDVTKVFCRRCWRTKAWLDAWIRANGGTPPQ